MTREISRRALASLARWGFATLVGVAAIGATWAAVTVDPPAKLPSFALQAASVYRLEVGAAFFVGFYLCSMTFVLALNNRAFSEIGTAGTRARDIRDLDDKERLVERLEAELRQIDGRDR